jgi:hypothetical protein
LQGRHPRANRRTLIDPIPTVLSQVTAACPGFIASSSFTTLPIFMAHTTPSASLGILVELARRP